LPPRRQKLSSAGVETTLLIFPGGIDSAQPYGSVRFDAEGNLYGTTYNTPSSFGPAGPGTVYKLTPGGTYTTLYGFSGGADGGHPTDTLVIGSAGNLYGTASTGGAANAGVVFKVDPAGVETVLYSFLEPRAGQLRAARSHESGQANYSAPHPRAVLTGRVLCMELTPQVSKACSIASRAEPMEVTRNPA